MSENPENKALILAKLLNLVGFQVGEEQASLIYMLTDLIEQKGSKVSVEDVDNAILKIMEQRKAQMKPAEEVPQH